MYGCCHMITMLYYILWNTMERIKKAGYFSARK